MAGKAPGAELDDAGLLLRKPRHLGLLQDFGAAGGIAGDSFKSLRGAV